MFLYKFNVSYYKKSHIFKNQISNYSASESTSNLCCSKWLFSNQLSISFSLLASVELIMLVLLLVFLRFQLGRPEPTICN